MDVVFTGHALDRWGERFPAGDIDAAFARSVRVPAVTLMVQSRAVGRAMHVRCGDGDLYRRDSHTGAVFACREEHGRMVVVTVLRFPKPKRVRAKDRTWGRRPDSTPDLEVSEW
jgi:hypothetical protein